MNRLNDLVKRSALHFLPADKAYQGRRWLSELTYQLRSTLHPEREVGGWKFVLDRPLRLGIETTNACNADCIFCAYQYQERPKSVMPTSVFAKAVKEYAAWGGGSLELTPVVGDPLMDKEFLEKVCLAAAELRIRPLYFYTNAILLDPVRSKALIESGITDLHISTTGFDQEMYQRVYRSNQYPRVIQNLIDLLEINQGLSNPVNIRIFVRADRSIAEVEQFPDYARIRKYPCEFHYSYYFDNWAGAIASTDLSPEMNLLPIPEKKGPCELLMVYPKILVNGDVTACGCRDYNGKSELILGNLHQNTLQEIWQNGKIEKIFKRFWNQDYPDICKDCRLYRSARQFLASPTSEREIATLKSKDSSSHAPAAF